MNMPPPVIQALECRSYAGAGVATSAEGIAVSDHTGALYDKNGLDIPALMRPRPACTPASPLFQRAALRSDQILHVPLDVLVPAAMERVIDAGVAENLKCRVLAEGANGPSTPDADLVLEKRQDEIFLMSGHPLQLRPASVVSYFEWVRTCSSCFWEEEE